MTYALPSGFDRAQHMHFPAAVAIPKNPSGKRGSLLSSGPGTPPVLGFRAKKWGTGQNGDKKAVWRKGRGLNQGMRSTKFVVAKTARAA